MCSEHRRDVFPPVCRLLKTDYKVPGTHRNLLKLLIAPYDWRGTGLMITGAEDLFRTKDG